MPTSSFGKIFTVSPEEENEFVDEMSKPAKPLLDKNFHSKLTHLKDNEELKKEIHNALSEENKNL